MSFWLSLEDIMETNREEPEEAQSQGQEVVKVNMVETMRYGPSGERKDKCDTGGHDVSVRGSHTPSELPAPGAYLGSWNHVPTSASALGAHRV